MGKHTVVAQLSSHFNISVFTILHTLMHIKCIELVILGSHKEFLRIGFLLGQGLL